jgi:UDP-N-acetylmuramoyl-L-alanyl-D-glutamate--2,6-diaminopimelate ligase
LHVLFGAGGDRDPGKRPLMGRAAAEAADRVWITDDNPRSENPAAIRAAVMAGCPGAIDAGAREEAIVMALGALGPGDVLAVAGKGHETGQEIAGIVHPFDDVAVVRRLAGCAP